MTMLNMLIERETKLHVSANSRMSEIVTSASPVRFQKSGGFRVIVIDGPKCVIAVQ